MPYDDWNIEDEDEDEELQSYYESAKGVILFCVDCSESMLQLRDDKKADQPRSHLLAVLQSAIELQKRKVITSPNDSVGILFFNTLDKSDVKGGDQVKDHNYLYQPITQINAPNILELVRLVHTALENPDHLRNTFRPAHKRIPMSEVFISCNWVFRNGSPKAASKRIFLITDEDDPHAGNDQLFSTARETLQDLYDTGVTVEPFFISTEDKPFNPDKLYSGILSRSTDSDIPDVVPSVVDGFDSLLESVVIRESAKRALFSIPFHLGEGFTISVKGYGLITEQKKGPYQYFTSGRTMEEAFTKTVYIDEEQQTEVGKGKIVYGMSLGSGGGAGDEDADGDGPSKTSEGVVRSRVFFTEEDVRNFRTLGLQPGLKLLGFKDSSTLAPEDNIKHSLFIYPNEDEYIGSTRTFSALLKTMVAKDKIALVLGTLRRNSTPVFYAMLPQEEVLDDDDGAQMEPPGFHLIALPFADDIRSAPVESALGASETLKAAARAVIDKLSIKKGGYQPDANPNPALSLHYSQLEAQAFGEEFDPDTFEDKTLPKVDMIHKRAGSLMVKWKRELDEDEHADTVVSSSTGTKRKADVSVGESEIRSRYDDGELGKLRVDQLKEFLKSKGQAVSGKKAELVERVGDWLDAHPGK